MIMAPWKAKSTTVSGGTTLHTSQSAPLSANNTFYDAPHVEANERNTRNTNKQDDDDGWATEHSNDASPRRTRGKASRYGEKLLKPPPPSSSARSRAAVSRRNRVGPPARSKLHCLPTRIIRILCFGILVAIVIFILALVRASAAENKLVGSGIWSQPSSGPPAAGEKPLLKAWEKFPFLRRYYGGIRTLVPLSESQPEYPPALKSKSESKSESGPADTIRQHQTKSEKLDADGQQVADKDAKQVKAEHSTKELVGDEDGVEAMRRKIPDSKAFAQYPGAALDQDFMECFLDEDNTLRVPGLRYFDGRPKGFPNHIYGSYKVMGLPEDICFERYGRLGPYGLGYRIKDGGLGVGMHGDQEGAEQVWDKMGKVNYTNVDWAQAQRRCFRANLKRFHPPPRKEPTHGFFITDEVTDDIMGSQNLAMNELQPHKRTVLSEPPTLKDKKRGASASEAKLPRSAVVLRCWDSFVWNQESILTMRSLVSELSLASGGRYDVHLLVQVRDDAAFPVMADADTYRRRVEESVPKEFRGMVTLWTVTQMLAIYQGIHDTFDRGPDLPVHGAYRGLLMALQYFASIHPEYEYIWHWEMDLRYTGHYLDFFTKTERFARAQPRKGLWERNDRFYFPSVHGSWADFVKLTQRQTDQAASDSTSPSRAVAAAAQDNRPHVSVPPSVWGPVRPSDPADHFATASDPPLPPISSSQDNYGWGVGEEADLIHFSPIFDPEGTTWLLRNDITGYKSNPQLPPRRAAIVTAGRLSRRLLMTMHHETAFKKHFAFSEMWPATVALHHGYKAVYAPHPVYVDREWPVGHMSTVWNNGANGGAGGARGSIFGEREHNLLGVTFYYNSGFGRNLWARWLGLRVNNDGGEGFEVTRDSSGEEDGEGASQSVGAMRGGEGRMCLPPVLIHPVRDIAMPVEIVHEMLNVEETDPASR